MKNNNEIKNRMKTFKIMLEKDEDGKVDPYKLTFVYKTGFKDGLNGEDFKSPRKNAKKKNKFIGKDSAELSTYTNTM